MADVSGGMILTQNELGDDLGDDSVLCARAREGPSLDQSSSQTISGCMR